MTNRLPVSQLRKNMPQVSRVKTNAPYVSQVRTNAIPVSWVRINTLPISLRLIYLYVWKDHFTYISGNPLRLYPDLTADWDMLHCLACLNMSNLEDF